MAKSNSKQSIMTPHVKEFDRLFGEHTHWISRLETAKTKATELESIIYLKINTVIL
jgi:Predicted sugar kinase